jgi:hypothetical protein
MSKRAEIKYYFHYSLLEFFPFHNFPTVSFEAELEANIKYNQIIQTNFSTIILLKCFLVITSFTNTAKLNLQIVIIHLPS